MTRLDWTEHEADDGEPTRWSAAEIRNRAAMTHTVEPGVLHPDGRQAFALRTMVLWPAGDRRHHAELNCYAVTDPGQDVLEAAEVVAGAWAV
jgi:hypothetical protein